MKTITASGVSGMLEERIRDTEVFLVEVSVKPGNSIRVIVDRPGGISVDECAEISRFLNEQMGPDAGDYALEVSSPGVGTPFRVRQQYENHIGRDVEVVMNDGRKLKGTLRSFDKEVLRLVTGGKETELRFEQIKTTKATISFK